MSPSVDITIIGAGVVGLAIASELALENSQVYLLEKNQSFGREQSSRNSETIHAGIHYARNSLKAKLCVEANAHLYSLCKRAAIAHFKCGKIVIATSAAEDEALIRLYHQGLDNGVELKMLSKKETKNLEPDIKGTSAFFSPNTGIIDAHSLMQYFLSSGRNNGLHLAYNTEVTGVDKSPHGYSIKTKCGKETFAFTTRLLINAAGLYSDTIAGMAGIDIYAAGYKLRLLKGNYYVLSQKKNKSIDRLIYPVPMASTISAHVCYDVNWRLRFGPFSKYVDEINYATDDLTEEELNSASIIKALPFIRGSKFEPESSGIMAMLHGGNEGFTDFIIRHEYDRGLPGLINLVGIDSPGLTASPAIARYVGRIVEDIF